MATLILSMVLPVRWGVNAAAVGRITDGLFYCWLMVMDIKELVKPMNWGLPV